MCGIAGYFGLQKPDNQRIETALKLMVNRGPDHQAHVVLPAGPATCVLLHSRLSIVDLNPRSHQPFARGGCTLVYNGEIYNLSLIHI